MKKLLMVGLAGTNKDFLISIPTLVAYLKQFKEVTDEYDIKQLHYRANADIKVIIKEINEFNPDIVGFSLYMWNKAKINKIKKKLNKDVKIIYGGPDVTTSAKDTDNEYFIYNEGEEKLYNLLMGKMPTHQPYDKRPSIYLNNMMDEVLKEPNSRVNIETQKGCTMKCKYCLYHKNAPVIEYRDINMVLDEAEHIGKLGIKELRLLDANFFSDYKRACFFFEELVRRNLNFDIVIESCPRIVSDEFKETLKLYKKRGNKVITSFGIQSINPKVLKEVNRYRNEKTEIECFKELGKLGIIVKTDLILALPYDDKVSYLKSLDHIVNLMSYGNHALGLQVLRILPNTEINNLVKKHGIKYYKDYAVYKTKYMSRNDIIDCTRKNAVAMRLFHLTNLDNDSQINTLFFETRERTKKSIVELIQILQDKLMLFFKGTDSPFINPRFPGAENYYYTKMVGDVPDKWIKDTLRGIK